MLEGLAVIASSVQGLVTGSLEDSRNPLLHPLITDDQWKKVTDDQAQAGTGE
jgi:hypothetical protein